MNLILQATLWTILLYIAAVVIKHMYRDYKLIRASITPNQMEVLDFYPNRLGDIPPQDRNFHNGKETLIIVREGRNIANVMYMPSDIKKDAVDIANFFKHQDAVEYCNWYVTRKKEKTNDDLRI